MMSKKNYKQWFTLLIGMSLWQPSWAVMLEGIDVPDTINAVNGPEMTLQGAAVRDWYFVVSGYVGALYLERPSSNVAAILEDERYQRMEFTILISKMSARRIANAFYEAIQINTSEKEQAGLEEGLTRFILMIDGSLNKGDQGIFEYVPGKGARVIIAGEEKGVIPGKDVFNAILKVWIGATPLSQKFKANILGLSPKA